MVGRFLTLMTLALLTIHPASAGTTPPVLTGYVEDGEVTLTWAVLEGADSYTLQRTTENGTTFIYLGGSVNQYTETLDGNMLVAFVVSATSNGEESAPSNPFIIPEYPHCDNWGGIDTKETIPVYVYQHCFMPLPI